MLSVNLLKQQLDSRKKILLLDVRDTKEYHNGVQGHIAQAVNMPLEEMRERLQEIEDKKELEIYTICRTDKRSNKAAEILLENGFMRVLVVQGGMSDWVRQGFPATRRAGGETSSTVD